MTSNVANGSCYKHRKRAKLEKDLQSCILSNKNRSKLNQKLGNPPKKVNDKQAWRAHKMNYWQNFLLNDTIGNRK